MFRIIRPMSIGIAGLMLFGAGEAMAWGGMGHRATGEIAAKFLSVDAKRAVTHLLGNASPKRLGQAARWPDKVARKTVPESKAWHFVNVPTKRLHYDSIYCAQHTYHLKKRPNECVIAMIHKFARIAGNPRFPKLRRAEALNYVIHFVGDVHNPVHCGHRFGRRDDLAGLDIDVQLEGGKTVTLHKFWDTSIVAKLDVRGISIGQNLAKQITPSQHRKWSAGRPAQWCSESVRIAHKHAYPPDARPGAPPVRLSKQFSGVGVSIAALRLKRAGVRIALTLNRIFARRGAPAAKRHSSAHPR